MSVSETFLRGGRPSYTKENFVESFSGAYTRWRWVVCFPRQWCVSPQDNKMAAPCLLLLFGSSSANEDAQEWHLLYVAGLHDAVQAVHAHVVAVSVSGFMSALPPGAFPTEECSILAALDGSTHERLGLFERFAWERQLQLLEGYFSRFPMRRPLVLRTAVLHRGVEEKMPLERINRNAEYSSGTSGLTSTMYVSATFTEVVWASVAWVLSEAAASSPGRGGLGMEFAVDASIPHQHGPNLNNEALMRLMHSLPDRLWSSRFVEQSSAASRRAGGTSLPDPITLTGFDRVQAEHAALVEYSKQRAGEWMSFVLPLHVNEESTEKEGGSRRTADSEAFRNVLLLQRPQLVKRQVDMDNRDPGPLDPQPISAELHLLPDPGDVLYLLEHISQHSCVEFHYDDYLHEEGEVMVQLAPLEGVDFADIDRYLEVIGDAEATIFRDTPVCMGSCSRIVFPRVVRRVPTNSVEKANVLARLRVRVESCSPSQAMMDRAVEVLSWMAKHLDPPRDGDGPGWYTISDCDDNASPIVSDRQCAWCQRRRTKLLRCGGCKAMYYCCKKHQAADWKEGQHKQECALWRSAGEITRDTLLPGLKNVCRGVAESYAMSIADFVWSVAASTAAIASTAPLCLHLIGVEVAHVESLLQHLARVLSEGRSQLHECQVRILLFSEDLASTQRNLVYSADKTGVVGLTASSGVLGDTWHLHSPGAADSMLLLRLLNMKYHHYDRSNPSQVGDVPSGVVLFGPLSGAGLTYLTAAVELAANDAAGRIPLRFVDSSLVGSHRSRGAFLSRLEHSASAEAAACLASLSNSSPGDGIVVRCNLNGCSTITTDEVLRTDGKDAGGATQPCNAMSTDEVASFINSFVFDVPTVAPKAAS